MCKLKKNWVNKSKLIYLGCVCYIVFIWVNFPRTGIRAKICLDFVVTCHIRVALILVQGSYIPMQGSYSH